MIVNYIKGGIGNQLFQHAFAKSLSQRLNIELYSNISYYENDPYGFKSQIKIMDPEIQLIKLETLSKDGAFLLQEGQVKALNQIKQLPGSVKTLLLEGYWQGEHYFDPQVALEFYKHMAHYAENSSLAEKFLDKITHCKNSIAVHIRRKDYAHMGLCKTTYYCAAIDFIRSSFSEAELFIFSDEPNFTRHLLNSRNLNYTFIDTGDDVIDLHIMSKCKHFIISNSSYSWWGAWFGENKDQENTTVIAPKEWVTINALESPCPERWILAPGAVTPFALENNEIENMKDFFNAHSK